MTKEYTSIEIRKLDKGYLVSKNDPVSSLPQPIAALTSFEEVLRVLREHFEEVKTPPPAPSIGMWAAMKDPLRQQVEDPKKDPYVVIADAIENSLRQNIDASEKPEPFTYELYADGNMPKVGDFVVFDGQLGTPVTRLVTAVERDRVRVGVKTAEGSVGSWWAPSSFKLVRRADEAPRPGMLSGGVVPCAKPALQFPSQQAENFDDCA